MNRLNKIFFIFLLPLVLYSQDFFKDELKRKSYLFNKIDLNSFPISENQRNFDIKYYKIEIDIDTFSASFIGKTTIIAEVVNKPIDSIDLDFAMKNVSKIQCNFVDSVKLLGKNSLYTYYDSTLCIKLDKKYNPGEKLFIEVNYHSITDGFYFMIWKKTDFPVILDKSVVWTLSEPFGARFWYPCKDYPEDKADSVDIIITVPKGYIAVSNGILKSETELGNKKKYHWQEKYPIATYLTALFAYPYKTFINYYKYSENDSMAIHHYYFSDTSKIVKYFTVLPEMMNIFTELYGEYPFIKEKYGHIEIPWPIGMENQTITSLGYFNEEIVAHELAHSWWGNLITCKDFHHVWFNESFASYSEALFFEKKYGTKKYKEKIKIALENVNNPGTIYRENLSDDAQIFNYNLIYLKSSLVLHMLRHVVGDSIFFKIIKELPNEPHYRFKNIDTEEFREYCESKYGKSLSWFFYQWIYQEYYPYYEYKWFKFRIGDVTSIKLTITQTQNNYIFSMPIDVYMKSAGWDTTIVIFDSLKYQEFDFVLNKDVDSVFIDKDNWILKKVDYKTSIGKMSDEFSFSLSNNYPNPFNNQTIINFSLKYDTYFTLKLFDILGREVMNILEERRPMGRYSISLKADKLTSGIYFYRLNTGDFVDVKKMILLK